MSYSKEKSLFKEEREIMKGLRSIMPKNFIFNFGHGLTIEQLAHQGKKNRRKKRR